MVKVVVFFTFLTSSSPLISAVLVDLHHPNPAANDVDGEIGGFGDGADACGPVNVDSVQQVIAAKWAVDVINNQSLPHELKIGKNERELFPIRVRRARSLLIG